VLQPPHHLHFDITPSTRIDDKKVLDTPSKNSNIPEQDQGNRLIAMIQALNDKIETFKGAVNDRFNNLEHRMASLENLPARRISSAANPGTFRVRPAAAIIPDYEPGLLPRPRVPITRQIDHVPESRRITPYIALGQSGLFWFQQETRTSLGPHTL
jgi:tetrahydromethanopterin S-methyltransferase subunit B